METLLNLNIGDTIQKFLSEMMFAEVITSGKWIMILVACFFLYLAIHKQYEPLLLLPIAFGMLITNLPGAEMYHTELFEGGHVHWENFSATAGLIDYLYLGVKLGIYPPLIFLARRRDDRLRSPDRQPQVPAAGRCRAAGHLHRVLWRLDLRHDAGSRRPPSASSAARTALPPSSSPPSWRLSCWGRSRLRRIPTWRWCPSSSRPS